MASTPIANLKRYWLDWETKLNALVKDRVGARLFFPSLMEVGPDREFGYFTISPVDPICLYNAPPKASSGKTSASSTKLAIFIDGDFQIYPKTADRELGLRATSCCLTFYKCTETKEGVNLTLFDAVHFDHEIHDSETAFHPVFHAQRGISKTVNDAVVRRVLSENLHIQSEKIVIDSTAEKIIGMPYLRLPTPQLDLFSALTLVMADFFCNGGDKNPEIKTCFQSILTHLTNHRNIVRHGSTLHALKNRISSDHISTAHWYTESS